MLRLKPHYLHNAENQAIQILNWIVIQTVIHNLIVIVMTQIIRIATQLQATVTQITKTQIITVLTIQFLAIWDQIIRIRTQITVMMILIIKVNTLITVVIRITKMTLIIRRTTTISK